MVVNKKKPVAKKTVVKKKVVKFKAVAKEVAAPKVKKSAPPPKRVQTAEGWKRAAKKKLKAK